jgi:hypothetical protein
MKKVIPIIIIIAGTFLRYTLIALFFGSIITGTTWLYGHFYAGNDVNIFDTIFYNVIIYALYAIICMTILYCIDYFAYIDEDKVNESDIDDDAKGAVFIAHDIAYELMDTIRFGAYFDPKNTPKSYRRDRALLSWWTIAGLLIGIFYIFDAIWGCNSLNQPSDKCTALSGVRDNVYMAFSLCIVFGIIAWNIPTWRHIVTGVSDFRTTISMIFGFAITYCLYKFFYTIININKLTVTQDEFFTIAVFGLLPFVALTIVRIRYGVGRNPHSGIIKKITRNGFPSIEWSQEVGTGISQGQLLARMDMRVMLGVLASGAITGFFVFGGWRGAIIGGLAAAGFSQQPRQKTDVEQRHELEPVTRHEDCEVFLQEHDGELFFCLARGDKTKGALPVIAGLPLKDIGHFEIGGHAEWLRSNAQPANMRDWNIIFTETRTSGVFVVAEWVHDKIWLTELRGRLAERFDGEERDRILEAYQRGKEGGQSTLTHSAPPPSPSPPDAPPASEIPKEF